MKRDFRPYLINLASPDPDLWQRSIDTFVDELERAETLGLLGVVGALAFVVLLPSHPPAPPHPSERQHLLNAFFFWASWTSSYIFCRMSWSFCFWSTVMTAHRCVSSHSLFNSSSG